MYHSARIWFLLHYFPHLDDCISDWSDNVSFITITKLEIPFRCFILSSMETFLLFMSSCLSKPLPQPHQLNLHFLKLRNNIDSIKNIERNIKQLFRNFLHSSVNASCKFLCSVSGKKDSPDLHKRLAKNFWQNAQMQLSLCEFNSRSKLCRCHCTCHCYSCGLRLNIDIDIGHLGGGGKWFPQTLKANAGIVLILQSTASSFLRPISCRYPILNCLLP